MHYAAWDVRISLAQASTSWCPRGSPPARAAHRRSRKAWCAARARVRVQLVLRRARRRRSVPSTPAWKAGGVRRPVARVPAHARRLPLVLVRVLAPVPGLPRADAVAEAASPLGFQISAPVNVVQRPDGLTLRGREGEIHIVTGAAACPAAWLEVARGGVTVSQALAGDWTVVAKPMNGAPSNVGNAGSMAPVWTVPLVALRWHRALPGLLAPLGQPFQGSPTQRVLGRVLVRLLGLPGVVKLLVSWHRRRTQK